MLLLLPISGSAGDLVTFDIGVPYCSSKALGCERLQRLFGHESRSLVEASMKQRFALDSSVNVRISLVSEPYTELPAHEDVLRMS